MFEFDIDSYGLDKKIAVAYTESLCEHIAYVREAGRQLGVPTDQLDVHDKSKWSRHEFVGYAKHFNGGGAPDEFANAWLHHIHHNPHHWQHWIFPGRYTPKGSAVENGVVYMPENYALEMVADWMGAGKAYAGSWDIEAWLSKAMPIIHLHSKTAEYVRSVLSQIGYAEVAYGQHFGHEKAT